MALTNNLVSTEIGLFPSDWKVATLSSLTEFMTSGSRGWAKFYAGSGALFIRSQNVRAAKLDFTDRQFVMPQANAEATRTRVTKGDLLITMTGNSVGNVAWVSHDLGEAYISQHVGLVRLNALHIAEYICAFLAPGAPGNPQIWASQSGQSKPGLNFSNLQGFFVVLPQSHEQRAICMAIQDADTWIESLEQLIGKKRQIKQGAMQELLTGKRRLPGFSGEWVTVQLGDCGEVVMGQSPPGATYNRTGIGSPLINGPTEFTEHIPVKIQWTTEPSRFCKQGDLLICVRGSSTGRTNYADDEYAIGRGVAAIRAKTGNITEFLSYQVIAGVAEILSAATGSTFPSVDGASFRKIKILLPSPVEQTKIANVLSGMQSEIAALESKLAKARQIKEAMMQELLTGRIRLVEPAFSAVPMQEAAHA